MFKLSLMYEITSPVTCVCNNPDAWCQCSSGICASGSTLRHGLYFDGALALFSNSTLECKIATDSSACVLFSAVLYLSELRDCSEI